MDWKEEKTLIVMELVEKLKDCDPSWEVYRQDSEYEEVDVTGIEIDESNKRIIIGMKGQQ